MYYVAKVAYENFLSAMKIANRSRIQHFCQKFIKFYCIFDKNIANVVPFARYATSKSKHRNFQHAQHPLCAIVAGRTFNNAIEVNKTEGNRLQNVISSKSYQEHVF